MFRKILGYLIFVFAFLFVSHYITDETSLNISISLLLLLTFMFLHFHEKNNRIEKYVRKKEYLKEISKRKETEEEYMRNLLYTETILFNLPIFFIINK